MSCAAIERETELVCAAGVIYPVLMQRTATRAMTLDFDPEAPDCFDAEVRKPIFDA